MAIKDHPSTPNSTMQHNLINDESEETVSLCDFPIYSYDTNYSSNITDSHEDSMEGNESFEFFSEEWLKNDKDSNFFPNKHIVFGGSLIFPKQPISRNTQELKKHDYGSNKVNPNSTSGRDREFAKFMSMNKGRTHGGEHETKRMFPASSSQKSRWYYYGFGLAGVPAEMDLSAIKSRQKRHRRSNHSAGGAQGGGVKAENGGFRHGKGLSRLIRDLSCDGQTQANSMVKASLVCIPRV